MAPADSHFAIPSPTYPDFRILPLDAGQFVTGWKELLVVSLEALLFILFFLFYWCLALIRATMLKVWRFGVLRDGDELLQLVQTAVCSLLVIALSSGQSLKALLEKW